MITRIEIDGFKSLRNFSLDLVPFMGIVGINGAGKSNLFEALSLLSRLASMDVTSALKAGRGHIRDQFSRNKNGNETKMTLAAEFLLPPIGKLPSGKEITLSHTKVRYEVDIERHINGGGLEEITIKEEYFKALEKNESNKYKMFFLFGEPKPEDYTDNLYWHSTVYISGGKSEGLSKSHFVSADSSEKIVTKDFLPVLAVIFTTQQLLQSFLFSQFEPNQLRTNSQTADTKILAWDGSNLPTVLAALTPEALANVRANFVRFVSGASNIKIFSRDDEFYFEVVTSDGQSLPARIVSDGTLRVLALLTLVYAAKPGSLIAVEELENGIYPGRLLELLEFLQETTKEKNGLQILVSSHSPVIIESLKNKPNALAFLDVLRSAGLRSTRARKIQEGSDPKTTLSMKEVERILASTRMGGV